MICKELLKKFFRLRQNNFLTCSVSMEELIVIGAGGHASVVIDAVEKQGRYSIVGIVDKSKRGEYLGYDILGDETALTGYPETYLVIAIGDNWIRKNISDRVRGFPFATIIHPSANIARDVKIGHGTVVLPGATVNTGATIGRHCIINTGAIIEHDCIVEDYAAVQPGAVLGGNSTLGLCSVIGIGASVIHGINIGDNSVIGAGSTVISDIESSVVAYGTPAKTARNRRKGEPYL
ncbi:MAG: acetyltransferase [Candidatus Dadabacteria bacterium]|nr:MAG: acetyltransferase [Candidatus Dadabacteria bacterium]